MQPPSGAGEIQITESIHPNVHDKDLGKNLTKVIPAILHENIFQIESFTARRVKP
jgi:hypothetical protein